MPTISELIASKPQILERNPLSGPQLGGTQQQVDAIKGLPQEVLERMKRAGTPGFDAQGFPIGATVNNPISGPQLGGPQQQQPQSLISAIKAQQERVKGGVLAPQSQQQQPQSLISAIKAQQERVKGGVLAPQSQQQQPQIPAPGTGGQQQQQQQQNPFQAGAFDPEIAKILASITQPSQPLSGDTLEDFSLPPASGLFGRPIAFNPSGGAIGPAGTIDPVSIDGPSTGSIIGSVLPGLLAPFIKAFLEGQQPGGQQPGGQQPPVVQPPVVPPKPEDQTGVNDPDTTGLGEGEDVPVGVQPGDDEQAGTGILLDPGTFQPPESSGSTFPPGTGVAPPIGGNGGAVDGVSNIISNIVGGNPVGTIGNLLGNILPGDAGQVVGTVASILGPAFSNPLTAIPAAIFSVFAFPLFDFLNRGKGERSDIADGFEKNLQPLFTAASLGQIDVGEVGGQGRPQDPKLPLPDHLQQFNGAGAAIGGLLPIGQLQRRGHLLRDLIDNNLVKSGANEKQALTIYSSLLPKTWDELVGKLPGNVPQLMGGFAGHDDAVGTQILQTTLREALTGAANVYIATGRLDAIPTAQIDALVSNAKFDVNAKIAAREKQKQHDEDLRNFDPSEDDKEELKRLEALVSDRVREREKDRRHDARDDT